MKLTLVILFFLQFSSPAMAAKDMKFWYKVESEKKEKKQKTDSTYPYDSFEKSAPDRQFAKTNIWSLRPKLSLSGGFHADKDFLQNSKTNRLFFTPALQLFTHPWHRWNLAFQLMQNNSMFVNVAWEITPSRERARSYYGIGVAHLLVSDKEFSNLVEGDSYYLTAHYGWEFLLPSNNGWSIEIKTFLSSDNYALQLSAGYIIPF